MFGDCKPRFSPVSLRQLSLIIGFTLCRSALYTAIVNILRLRGKLTLFLQSMLVVFLVFSLCARSIHAQDPAQKPSEKPAEKKAEKAAPPEKVENPAQIELLETSYRFEVSGDSHKEVHTRVKINSELGVRQFARLNFDYNRSFQSVEIPLVHITHPSGGTADILPSAITDIPNPAVVEAPAYQDVRVKSVRILGLEPGDNLEYRVITTTTHHPLSPDFWLDHSFDRAGVVSQELFEIDLPALLAPPTTHWADNVPQVPDKAAISSGIPTPEPAIKKVAEANGERVHYLWDLDDPSKMMESRRATDTASGMGDVELGLSLPGGAPSWSALSHRLYFLFAPLEPLPAEITQLAGQLTVGAETPNQKAERIYDFVSKKVKTIDLPLGATGFRLRPPAEIAASGYATQEDKVALFMALAKASRIAANPLLIGPSKNLGAVIARPSAFVHILVWAGLDLLDPSLEVAPFRMLPASYRGSEALNVGPVSEEHDGSSLVLTEIPKDLPFASSQRVRVEATLNIEGKLIAKVHYALRGDNELLLRVGFHQTPKDKWKELAQLLSISDGFRGQVTSVNASDPYATREPFTLDYEITMPKFADWSKKPVRIPALLPQLGLPDPPAKPVAGAATSPIELGTPLEVETRMTLRLPPGTTAQTPTGTSVQRDYATYASQYSAKGPSIRASRHINFLLREIPANRAVDYNSFLRAVQSDEAQDFTLDRPDSDDKKPAPAKPRP